MKTILINNQPYETEKETLTRIDVLEICGVSHIAGLMVTVENAGNKVNEIVTDWNTIIVKNGLKFTTMVDATMG